MLVFASGPAVALLENGDTVAGEAVIAASKADHAVLLDLGYSAK